MSQLHEKFKLYSEIEIIRFMNDKYNTLYYLLNANKVSEQIFFIHDTSI